MHPSFQHHLRPERAARLRRGLELLLEAHADAEQLGRPAADVTLDIGDCHKAGLHTHDLCWLVFTGHLEVTPPLTQPEAPATACNGSLVFTDQSRFFLTPAGIVLVRRILKSQPLAPKSPLSSPKNGQRLRPRWNKTTRELWLGDILIKRLEKPCPLQELILDAFQEEHWRAAIDDPLSPRAGLDSKQRLRDAIRRLNCCQINKLLRFRSNGKGTGIRWELRRSVRQPTRGLTPR